MKYEILWDEAQQVDGVTLYRIRALRDIPRYNVKAGDRGGWVAGEHNLSQDGDAWIADDAKVYGSAQVRDSARVFGRAHVFGKAWVTGRAWVFEDAHVFGNVHVYGVLCVCGARRWGN